ncbi:GDSL-type esterase/lipase family protein [Sulfurimonas sp.]|uniref:GDSL-type esterase/lipase family protein n=1 Tax=Sulfurimonas sp. TaxID=2022749 RepID=UPI00356A0666
MSNIKLIGLGVFFSFLVVLFVKNYESDTKEISLREGSVILAYGDSLTNGFGVSKEFSYPSQIEKKTGLKVINAGVNGEPSGKGLLRLPHLIKEHNPDLVILCHGANDILNKLSIKEMKENLLAMVRVIKQSGAEVLLVGVPDFSLFDLGVHDVYEEVAEEMDLLLEDEVIRYIELHRELKSDYVHPNKEGYEMMADKFIEVLKLKK